MVPIYVAIMAFAFATYLTLKGLKKIWPSIIDAANAITPFTFEMAKKPTLLTALTIGLVFAVITYIISLLPTVLMMLPMQSVLWPQLLMRFKALVSLLKHTSLYG